MPIIVGTNPADVYEKAYRFDAGNRANLNEIAGREAQYAFQTNQLLNERARQMANEQQQAQRYANELARENESIGENRFRFGQQLEQQKRAEDFSRLQFGAQQKFQDEQLKLKREQLRADDIRPEEVERTAEFTASTLGRLNAQAEQAREAAAAIAARQNAILEGTQRLGMAFDPVKLKFSGGPATTSTSVQLPEKLTFEFKKLSKDLADIQRNEQRARDELERAKTEAGKTALDYRFNLDLEGGRIVTPSGRVLPFARQVTSTTAAPALAGRVVNGRFVPSTAMTQAR